MTLADDLNDVFGVYFDEFDLCISGKCYWALLHLILTLPDISGAVESETGWAKEDKYIDWCRRYVADGYFPAENWWAIRCKVFHQAHTVAGPKGQTQLRYVFTQPGRVRVHKVVVGNEVVLDVHELASEVRRGIVRWIGDIASGAGSATANARPSTPTVRTRGGGLG